ncbi:hypothetical protein, partial [Brucella melitensis]
SEKWNLTEDEYFKNKYKRLGWRRQMALISPFVRKLPIGKFGWRVVGKLLLTIDKVVNRYITTRYAQKHLQNLS